jgi:hypothetical protein
MSTNKLCLPENLLVKKVKIGDERRKTDQVIDASRNYLKPANFRKLFNFRVCGSSTNTTAAASSSSSVKASDREPTTVDKEEKL